MSDCERFRVSGRVQGVGFRAHTRRIALAHQLTGWANNCSDGSVDILLCGPGTKIELAKPSIIAGPAQSHVERVESLDAPPTLPLEGFSIR